ncbi:MAG: hypothetical protein K2I06_03870, partial [Ruminococcus sp.]|nr:hypothetical protein [Ruminococcus sp.]
MVQSVTKAVNSVNADSAMLGKIIAPQQRSSAEKLLEMFKKVETKVNKIYDKDKWIKIENKPFYYCKEGSLYVVDPSRYQCANSGGFPSSVESVPTQFLYCGDWSSYIRYAPFWKPQGGNLSIITNKDGKNYDHILCNQYDDGRNNYWRGYYFYNNGSSSSSDWCWSYAGDAGSSCLRLPVAKNIAGFQNALKYNLMPEGLSKDNKELFKLMVLFQKKDSLQWDNDSIT